MWRLLPLLLLLQLLLLLLLLWLTWELQPSAAAHAIALAATAARVSFAASTAAAGIRLLAPRWGRFGLGSVRCHVAGQMFQNGPSREGWQQLGGVPANGRWPLQNVAVTSSATALA